MKLLPYTLAMLAALPAVAQDKAATPTPYQVEILIRDANDASAKAGRRYTMQLDNMNSRGVIRSGSKVSYMTTNGFNYADLGVNIECRLSEREGRLTLYTNLGLNTLAEGKQNGPPTTAQMNAEVGTVVTPGKPAPIFIVDDTQLQRNIRIEAVVTAVK